MILSEQVIEAAQKRAHAMGFALNAQMVASILVAAMEASGEQVAFGDEASQLQWIGSKIDTLVSNVKNVFGILNNHGDRIAQIENFLTEAGEDRKQDLRVVSLDARPEGV